MDRVSERCRPNRVKPISDWCWLVSGWCRLVSLNPHPVLEALRPLELLSFQGTGSDATLHRCHGRAEAPGSLGHGDEIRTVLVGAGSCHDTSHDRWLDGAGASARRGRSGQCRAFARQAGEDRLDWGLSAEPARALEGAPTMRQLREDSIPGDGSTEGVDPVQIDEVEEEPE